MWIASGIIKLISSQINVQADQKEFMECVKYAQGIRYQYDIIETYHWKSGLTIGCVAGMLESNQTDFPAHQEKSFK